MISKRLFHIKKILKPTKSPLAPGEILAEPHLVKKKTFTLDTTASMQLPIYRNFKRGMPITRIRKIVGNVEVTRMNFKR